MLTGPNAEQKMTHFVGLSPLTRALGAFFCSSVTGFRGRPRFRGGPGASGAGPFLAGLAALLGATAFSLGGWAVAGRWGFLGLGAGLAESLALLMARGRLFLRLGWRGSGPNRRKKKGDPNESSETILAFGERFCSCQHSLVLSMRGMFAYWWCDESHKSHWPTTIFQGKAEGVRKPKDSREARTGL